MQVAGISTSIGTPDTDLTSIPHVEEHDEGDRERTGSFGNSPSCESKDALLAVPTFEGEVDAYTNHDIIERCFADCDLTGEGRLHYQEFKMWVNRNPAIIEYFEELLPYSGMLFSLVADVDIFR